MKKVMLTLFTLFTFVGAAVAQEIIVCESVVPIIPKEAICTGVGSNPNYPAGIFAKYQDSEIHLVSVVFANGKFYSYFAIK